MFRIESHPEHLESNRQPSRVAKRCLSNTILRRAERSQHQLLGDALASARRDLAATPRSRVNEQAALAGPSAGSSYHRQPRSSSEAEAPHGEPELLARFVVGLRDESSRVPSRDRYTRRASGYRMRSRASSRFEGVSTSAPSRNREGEASPISRFACDRIVELRQ